MKKLKPNKILMVLTVMIATGAGASWATGHTAYDAAEPDGYFWYKDKPKPQSQVQQEPPPPQTQAQPAPQAAKLKPGSAEWFRKTEQELIDQMSTNPSEKNVLVYQALNRARMDRADEVARVWQRNLDKYPYLNESVRMPFAARARQQALWQIDQAKEGIMADISKKAGLWMFFDSSCNFCHAQYETVKMLQEKYKMEVRFISTDGGVIKGMSRRDVRYDNGAARARAMGIRITPAVVMVIPPDNAALVAHGALSLNELEQKIVTAAIDMKIADPKLAQTAKMDERGMINHSDWEAAGFTGNETPEELSEKIYNIISDKMR